MAAIIWNKIRERTYKVLKIIWLIFSFVLCFLVASFVLFTLFYYGIVLDDNFLNVDLSLVRLMSYIYLQMIILFVAGFFMNKKVMLYLWLIAFMATGILADSVADLNKISMYFVD